MRTHTFDDKPGIGIRPLPPAPRDGNLTLIRKAATEPPRVDLGDALGPARCRAEGDPTLETDLPEQSGVGFRIARGDRVVIVVW